MTYSNDALNAALYSQVTCNLSACIGDIAEVDTVEQAMQQLVDTAMAEYTKRNDQDARRLLERMAHDMGVMTIEEYNAEWGKPA